MSTMVTWTQNSLSFLHFHVENCQSCLIRGFDSHFPNHKTWCYNGEGLSGQWLSIICSQLNPNTHQKRKHRDWIANWSLEDVELTTAHKISQPPRNTNYHHRQCNLPITREKKGHTELIQHGFEKRKPKWCTVSPYPPQSLPAVFI